MNKGKSTIWLFLGVCILGLLFYFGLSNSNLNKEEPETFSDWSFQGAFDPFNKNPYGTFVLKELMDTGLVNVRLKMIKTGLDIESLKEVDSAIYLFVGGKNYMDSDQVDHLLSFVENGSTALLSFYQLPFKLEYALFEDGIILEIFNDQQKPTEFQLEGFNSHHFSFIRDNDTTEFEWYYFQEEDIFNPFQVLGTLKDQPNFIKVKYGKGSFYLHVNPYLFTNINLLEEEGLLYAEELFSFLPKGEVYWDIYSTTNNRSEFEEKRSEIEYILDNRSLRWAFFSLLIGAVIYGLFGIKRYFTSVAVLKPNENTSLTFVETISRLYRKQGTNTNLIQIKKENFQNFVTHYYFLPSVHLDANFRNKLAQKSNMPKEEIEEIIEKLEFGSKNQIISDQFVLELHKLLEDFYATCTGRIKKEEESVSIQELNLRIMRKSKEPLFIIGFGFILLFTGVFLLSLGSGIGVLGLIIGISIIAFGYYLFTSAYIKIENGRVSIFNGKKNREFCLSKLESTHYDQNLKVFTLNGRLETCEIPLGKISLKDQDILIKAIRNLKR